MQRLSIHRGNGNIVIGLALPQPEATVRRGDGDDTADNDAAAGSQS